VIDSVGLDVKVVVVADDKFHFEKLLEPITVSDFFSELNRASQVGGRSEAKRGACHASHKICGSRHLLMKGRGNRRTTMRELIR
jgi:hypothetical protein